MKEEIFNNIPLITEYSQYTQNYIKTVIERLYLLGKLDSVDVGSLAILAKEYETTIKIQKKFIDGEDYVIDGKRNPLVQIANSSAQICVSIMKEFGLTAKSRKKLNESDSKTAQSNCIIDEFVDN